jgi:hypothetical protein
MLSQVETRIRIVQGPSRARGVRGQETAELKIKVEESQRKLQEFARANGLVINSSSTAEERLRTLQGQLATATANRIAKQSVYEASKNSPTEALPAILDSGSLSGYQGQVAYLKKQLAEMSITMTPEDSKVQKVQAQIKELEGRMQLERNNIIERIRIEFDSARKQEERLEEDFKNQANLLSLQGEKLLQYKILLREAETTQKLYEETITDGNDDNALPDDYYLKSISSGVNDLLRKPLKVDVPSTPEVIIQLGIGRRIDGNVRQEDGRPAASVKVKLVPREEADRGRLTRTAVTDQNGDFTLRGAAPGEYILGDSIALTVGQDKIPPMNLIFRADQKLILK